MLISTTLETLINVGLQRNMCLYCLSTSELVLYSIVYCRIVYSKAEYTAMTEAMKEAIWHQGLLDDLKIDQDLLKINCDSISAIYLARN